MAKGTIVKLGDVVPFSPPEFAKQFSSKMLLDKSNSGSDQLHVNHFTLEGGCSTTCGVHKPPFDEIYYVLSGKATLELDGVAHDIEKDTLAFIPGGTSHSLKNKSETEDLVILTIWPKQPEPGVNVLYDMRKEAWGRTFRSR